MKKLTSLLIIAFLLLLIPSVLFAAGSSESSALEKIKSRGRLIVGTEALYAPFEFRDENANIVGCDMFLASEIASSIGVTLEIVDMAFDGIIPAVQTGQVDLGIAAFTNTAERAEVIDFSDIYMHSLQCLVVLAENTDKYTTEESLKGLKVGAQRGTNQSLLVQAALPESELFELSRYPELALEVQNGNIAGLVADVSVCESIVDASDGKLAIANFTFDPELANFGKSVVIQKGNPDLVEAVNEVIARILADGSYDRAWEEAVALQQKLGL